MFMISIKSKDGKTKLLELKTEERSYARGTKLLCDENGYPCEVTVEIKPREVNFK